MTTPHRAGPEETGDPRTDGQGPTGIRLSTRTAVVVLASLVCTAVVTGLMWWAGHHPAEAVMAGLFTLGGSFKFLDSLIG